MFLHYFERLRTNHYTLLIISLISFIFDSVKNLTRNLPFRPLWHFVKIPIAWREWWNTRWEKWLTRRFTKCHLYTSHFSSFANIILRSRQFDDKCIAGLRITIINLIHKTFLSGWYTVIALSSLFLLASDNSRNLTTTCFRLSSVFLRYVQKTYFRCENHLSSLTLFLRKV